jgi:hypothetical protein
MSETALDGISVAITAKGLRVEEQEFWKRLEFRISAEFEGFADKRLRHCWCDGLVPEDYDFSVVPPQIRGEAWCGGTGQERWQFTLVLDPGTPTREAIAWPALLPAAELTGWLSPYTDARAMTIAPCDGYVD